MKYDGKLSIAVGQKADSKFWKNENCTWSELVTRLEAVHRTHESYNEYLGLTKDDQSNIKDIGGFVGGYLRGGRRKPENVTFRQVLTLDMDEATQFFWEDFTMQYGNAALLHSTHKHSKKLPRYRLVIPLSREVLPDEYVAVARRLAGNMDIELFDTTTFEPNRLMFWPSASKDGDWVFETQDGPWLDVDKILSSYINWQDISEWPFSVRSKARLNKNITAQENPEEKRGIVGTFCRVYTIQSAIETFLKDKYINTGDGTRYTYALGSTAGGLVVYDDKFSYSHHSSDPSGGRLCNAFDLVRLHKFGHLDTDEPTDKSSKTPSFKAMEKLASKDPLVKSCAVQENLDSAKYDFAVLESNVSDDISDDWKKSLEIDTKGEFLNSAFNLSTIIANDPMFKGKFKYNSFDNKRYIFGNLPWRFIPEPEPIKDVDYSGMRNYIESIYGIVSTLKIDDAVALEFNKQSFHPVQEYLDSLKWDKKPRVDTLLIDYFGAEDNLYTREAMRKPLVAAVARAFKPGTKFDLVLTIVGPQGTGKSTFVRTLGKQWFSDTFITVQGKEAFEQIQGAWLIEIGELAGLKKAEVETIKHFISKNEDMFRPAYARTIEVFKRQCIFFGTTNNATFLKDPSGNRRFMPIDIHIERATKDIFSSSLKNEVDQIWAEAIQMYKTGESLFLSPEADMLANDVRFEHSEVDDRRGIIEHFMELLLPSNWDTMDIFTRRMYLDDPLKYGLGTKQRTTICVAEIWCECLGKEKEDMTRYNTRDINDILRSMPDWDGQNSTKAFPLYGKQKYYALKNDML